MHSPRIEFDSLSFIQAGSQRRSARFRTQGQLPNGAGEAVMAFTFEECAGGAIVSDGSSRAGYIQGGALFRGESATVNGVPWGGQQVGYFQGNVIFRGGSGTMNGSPYGGQQVGYIDGATIYEGDSGSSGGVAVGQVANVHPLWSAAAFLLLT